MSDEEVRSFAAAAKKTQPGVAREFFLFLRENRKFWLIPLLATLFLLSLLVLLGGTAAAPFIYTLF